MKFTSIDPYEYNNNDMFLDLVKFETILSGQLDNNLLIGMFLNVLYCSLFSYCLLIYCLFWFYLDVVGQAIDIGAKLTLQCSNGKE